MLKYFNQISRLFAVIERFLYCLLTVVFCKSSVCLGRHVRAFAWGRQWR